ncbi:hypothetical protein ACFWVP_34295 [Streptomyces sp. NPDC058637]|uniref:hypothetical protein n=1 Tax=Streptomyces sp. NPDC058637 TaxID=3346569 RepID=UPI00364837AE
MRPLVEPVRSFREQPSERPEAPARLPHGRPPQVLSTARSGPRVAPAPDTGSRHAAAVRAGAVQAPGVRSDTARTP